MTVINPRMKTGLNFQFEEKKNPLLDMKGCKTIRFFFFFFFFSKKYFMLESSMITSAPNRNI